MIGKLTGTFGGTRDGVTLVEVGGVGYVVRLPATPVQTRQVGAPLQQGEPVALFIHTAVREDAIDLYGFPTEEELRFFKQLMSVSGIGPKTALGIMGVTDTLTLKRAIAKGDASVLTKVFGIGKKSAERMVVELRDKLHTEVTSSSATTPGAQDEDSGEVLEALMALGYRADEARKALSGIDPNIQGTRERLASTLRYLGTVSK